HVLPEAERGRENEARAVQIDHALHRLLDLDRLGHVLLFHHLDAVDLLQRGDALRVALVPAVIVLRPYVGRADDEPRGRGGPGYPRSCASRVVDVWLSACGAARRSTGVAESGARRSGAARRAGRRARTERGERGAGPAAPTPTARPSRC